MTRPCAVDDCTRPAKARGWCGPHYQRWWRYGDPACGERSTVERFWEKVDKTDSCWFWTGASKPSGYGRFRDGETGRMTQAHRYSYELLVGPIPEGLTIDHLCKTPACVNPSHMEPVTNVENSLRGSSPWAINARKTHCPKGHEYTDANTYRRPTGARLCRTCESARWRRRRYS